MPVDAIDRKILAALAENGRAGYAELAERVPLSPSAIKRRVDRMVADGTIAGFTVRLSPRALGPRAEAFVELYCRNQTAPGEIRQMLAAHPEVVAAYTISGDADALLHLRAPDIAALEACIERIRAHPNAQRTNSRIVLSPLIEARGPRSA
jgi:DNA-binding Lrp family transcriptional regulator